MVFVNDGAVVSEICGRYRWMLIDVDFNLGIDEGLDTILDVVGARVDNRISVEIQI